MTESRELVNARLIEAAVDPMSVGVILDRSEAGAYNESGKWIITPSGGDAWVVGGVERNQLAFYANLNSLDLAVDYLLKLSTRPTQLTPFTQADMKAAHASAADLQARIQHTLATTGQRPAPITLHPGDMIDLFGHESAQGTFVMGTPLPQRSLAPTEVMMPYHLYRVTAPIEDDVVGGPVEPWFGQPGGGIKIKLPRSVRWYWDNSRDC